MVHISNLPTLDALQAALAASTTGSFSAAADQLNVTHGAVSRRVAGVEHWAGFPLFERHGRGVRPTLDGQQLMAEIERALLLLDDARARRPGIDLELVRVSVIPSFARLWLLPNLAALEGTPPDLRIEPDVDHRLMALSDARIAIRYGRGDWPGVSATPLFEETLYPVAAGRIAQELGRDAPPEALLRYSLIVDQPDQQWRQWFATCGIDYERRPQDRVIVDYDVTLQAVAEGHGITLLRDPYGTQAANRLGISRLTSHSVTSPPKFFVVTRPEPHHGAVERLVKRIIMLCGK